MATVITTINSSDQISSSRTDINANFSSLNTNKIETSAIDTDTALAAASDAKIPSQKAVKAYIDALGGLTNLVPVGTILPYGGASAPTYYLLCDGTAVSRSTYATLFAIIGTAFGAGNGSTTFNLPDFRGRSPVGASAVTRVATFVSRATNVLTVSGLPNNSQNEFQTGQAVTYHTSGSVITGLTNDTVYYLIRLSNSTFSLATTLALAQNGTAIALSSDGVGTQTFTLSSTTRAVGDMGGEETHAMTITELLAHTHTGSPSNPSGASGNSHLYENNANSGSTGGNTAMNNMHPFTATNFIIKI